MNIHAVAFIGGLLLALLIGGPVRGAECPSVSFSVLDAKGEAQLIACLKLANEMNVAALRKSLPADEPAPAPIYVVRITNEGGLDAVLALTPAAFEREKELTDDELTNYFILPGDKHYKLAEGAFEQFIGRAPAKNRASNKLAELVGHFAPKKQARKMPMSAEAAEEAIHGEDQRTLLSSNKKLR